MGSSLLLFPGQTLQRAVPRFRSVDQHAHVLTVLLDVVALVGAGRPQPFPAELVLSYTPGPADVFAHLGAGESSVAAELVSEVDAIGELLVPEQALQGFAPDGVPSVFLCSNRE